MKVLVTGATGFVGSHIADRLLEEGHEVRALTRKSSSTKWLDGKNIQLVHGNILDSASLEPAVSGVDAIVHIAGVTASKTKAGFFEGNQLATRALLEAVHTFNPHIQHFIQGSSQTAVGPSLDGQPVTERTPPHPITTYGLSKRAAEEECERMRQHFPISIVRMSAVYGPRDTAILTFFQTVSKRVKPLIGFRDKYINLVHVRDVANSIALMLKHEASKNQTYMIGSEHQYRWRDVSNLTSDILQKRGIIVRLPHSIVYTVAAASEMFSVFQSKPSVLNWEKGKDIVQGNWTLSVEKAKEDFGYKQNVSLEDGILDTTDWYKKEGWLK